MPQATAKKKPSKPKKPYPDFPLFPHATKRWAKKIRGKLHYFGPWDDPDAALAKYQREREDRYAGRTPRPAGDALTVRDLANRFLTTKRHLADTREITVRTFSEYLRTCGVIVDAFGRNRVVADIQADDFEALRASLARTNGPVRLGNEIQRVRGVFKYAFDQGLIDRPVRYGQSFTKPSRRIMRQARAAAGPRMFDAAEIQAVLGAASPQMKAMILLGINCGFGNSDVSSLPQSALDLKGGWVDFPRPKTAIERRAHLWPETIKAVKAALQVRPKHRADEDNDLVFITKYGRRWVRFNHEQANAETGAEAKAVLTDSVSLEFQKLLKALKLKRPGLGFYALRHTFQTIGEGARDAAAVALIMGHAPHTNDMSAVYREQMPDDRLKAVTDHVRKWLVANAKKSTRQKPSALRHRVIAD